MKIETKYNIGDTVFFLLDREICKGVITEVEVTIHRDRDNGKETCNERYTGTHSFGSIFLGMGAANLFTTPEELVKSLMDKFYKR